MFGMLFLIHAHAGAAIRDDQSLHALCRCHAKISAAPRALQFTDAPEVSSCTEQFGLMVPFDSPIPEQDEEA